MCFKNKVYHFLWSSKKELVKEGFTFFIVGSLTLFLQFFFYLVNSNFAATTDVVGYFYYIWASFAHAATFALIPYCAYILLIYCLPFPKINQFLLLLTYFLLNLLAYLNGIVFQLYKFHINGFVIDLITGTGAGQVFVFNTALVLRAVLTLLFILVLFSGLAYAAHKYALGFTARRIKIYASVFVAALLFAHLAHAYAAAANQASIRNVASCLPQFYPLTANTLMMKLGVVHKDELYSLSEKSVNTGVVYPLKPLQQGDTLPAKNIILIVLDSWNPRTLEPETCPRITGFTRQALLCNHHLSSSNGTRGSIFGMFFGVSATYWKEFEIAGIQPLLIKTLQEKGYDIQAFPSATLVNPPFYRIIFGDVKNIRTETTGATPFERDNQLTEDFLNYLDQSQQNPEKPFFAFLFYDLLHAIDLPAAHQNHFQPAWKYANYMALNNDLDPTPFYNLYRNCAWHADSLVGKVLEKLSAQGRLQNSVIVLTGDHGQEFNENHKNYWGHGGNYTKVQIQVPLIYYAPGIQPDTIFHKTTHYDITPTLMKTVLGVTNSPAEYSMGQFLTDPVRAPYHIVGNEENYAFVTESMIYEKKHTGRIVVTDSVLNPIEGKLHTDWLLEALQYKNRFMQSD